MPRVPSRAPRLAAILDALKNASKGRTRATAQRIADDLGVSLRTLYRDIDRLRAAGVSVTGRTGVGLSVAQSAKLPDALTRNEAALEARVRVTAEGARMLSSDPSLDVDRGRGAERVVRASRDALLRAALRSGGEVIVLAPEKLRREVRTRARDIARAHKG
jgi:predicted DNA-binding transcriptional regulator YafY